MADSPAPRPVPPIAPSSAAVDVAAQDGSGTRPQQVSEVLALADRAHAADGHPPLSDQTRGVLSRGRQRWLGLLRAEEGGLIGAAVLAPEGSETAGSVLELVVDPAARRAGNGTRLADAAATAVRGGGLEGTTSVWAHGMLPGSAELARRHGLAPVRELRRMRLEGEEMAALTAPRLPDGVRLRAFEPGRDEEAWLELNGAAFADHPEQGGLTRADLQDRMEQDWFDASGFLLAERAADGALLGFHWTKVEPAHDDVGSVADKGGHRVTRPRLGEVYVVGVSPHAQGMGLGRAVTLAGLQHLAAVPVDAVDLYVDAENAAAVALYESLGFRLLAADAQYRAERTG